MYTLYEIPSSGNSYKCRLAMHQLGLPFRRVAVNTAAGEQHQDWFRNMNPNCKLPTLDLGDGRYLAESNAILWYVADGTALLPQSPFARAQVLQWLFFEQYSHEPYIATVRYWLRYTPDPSAHAADIARCRPKGEKALAVMEAHLSQHVFFADERYSIADIALYAYTHNAGEGGYDLGRYPAVQRWLARVAAQERHLPLSA